MPVRTFIAAEMDEPIRTAIRVLQQELTDRSVEVRWTAPERMHLTLKFLGDIPDEHVPDVCEVARQVAAEVEPFSVDVTGIGTFGPRRHPHIIWCGFAGSADRLVQLHDRLDKRLRPLGVPREGRRYTPHLTVGRARARLPAHVPPDVLDAYTDWSAGSQRVDHVVVFSSRLGPGGPHYEALARCPLAGPGS